MRRLRFKFRGQTKKNELQREKAENLENSTTHSAKADRHGHPGKLLGEDLLPGSAVL